MALLDLYFDTTTKQLAHSSVGPLGAALPTLGQEEIISISLSAIKRVSLSSSRIFELRTIAGWALRIAVGTANNILAQQNTWTVDATNTKFEALLNLNTAGITALADRSLVWFEILLTDNLGAAYRKRFDVFIEKGVYLAASIITPPGDTALGTLAADRLYVRKEGRAGEAFILTSADGLKKGMIYWDNDGSFRAEAIT